MISSSPRPTDAKSVSGMEQVKGQFNEIQTQWEIQVFIELMNL